MNSAKEMWVHKITSAINSRNKAKQNQVEKYPLHEVCRVSDVEKVNPYIHNIGDQI